MSLAHQAYNEIVNLSNTNMATLRIDEVSHELSGLESLLGPPEPSAWLLWSGSVIMTSPNQLALGVTSDSLGTIAKNLESDTLEEVKASSVTLEDGNLLFNFDVEGPDEFAALAMVGLAVQAAINSGIDRANIYMQNGHLAPHAEVITYSPGSATHREDLGTWMDEACYNFNMLVSGRLVTLQSVV